MKIILSPAKTLDFETEAQTKKSTQPKFLKDSKLLIGELEKLSAKKISSLMDISAKLADLNYERFQNFAKQPKKQAALAFDGDVYTGLAAKDFSEADLEFAQKHLIILSGLYGMLKPLDLIQAHRLEMGTDLVNERGKNLYQFWGDKITKEIGDELVINLASQEYFSVIKPAKYIDIVFKENKNGKLTIVAIFAKIARGMMARYIIKKRITTPAKIKLFKEGDYEFRSELSTDTSFVFVRKAKG